MRGGKEVEIREGLERKKEGETFSLNKACTFMTVCTKLLTIESYSFRCDLASRLAFFSLFVSFYFAFFLYSCAEQGRKVEFIASFFFLARRDFKGLP